MILISCYLSFRVPSAVSMWRIDMSNPGWFGPKDVGVGVSPKTWQGWLVVVAYVVIVFLVIRYRGWSMMTRGSIAIGLTIAVLAIAFFTYRRTP